jgi:hypothetical protein
MQIRVKVWSPVSTTPANISANARKIWNGLHGILRGPRRGKLFMKKPEVENLVSYFIAGMFIKKWARDPLEDYIAS